MQETTNRIKQQTTSIIVVDITEISWVKTDIPDGYNYAILDHRTMRADQNDKRSRGVMIYMTDSVNLRIELNS